MVLIVTTGILNYTSKFPLLTTTDKIDKGEEKFMSLRNMSRVQRCIATMGMTCIEKSIRKNV